MKVLFPASKQRGKSGEVLCTCSSYTICSNQVILPLLGAYRQPVILAVGYFSSNPNAPCYRSQITPSPRHWQGVLKLRYLPKTTADSSKGAQVWPKTCQSLTTVRPFPLSGSQWDPIGGWITTALPKYTHQPLDFFQIRKFSKYSGNMLGFDFVPFVRNNSSWYAGLFPHHAILPSPFSPGWGIGSTQCFWLRCLWCLLRFLIRGGSSSLALPHAGHAGWKARHLGFGREWGAKSKQML